jgi:hypothetical protein
VTTRGWPLPRGKPKNFSGLGTEERWLLESGLQFFWEAGVASAAGPTNVSAEAVIVRAAMAADFLGWSFRGTGLFDRKGTPRWRGRGQQIVWGGKGRVNNAETTGKQRSHPIGEFDD